MKPSDCTSGKWYYFKWLFHSQPVYFKYNRTISSNILVGRCSIWKTGYTHGGAYSEDEIENIVEVDPSISDIQSKLPDGHPDKIAYGEVNITTISKQLQGDAKIVLQPGQWYLFDWKDHRTDVIGKAQEIRENTDLLICSDSIWYDTYHINNYYNLSKIVNIRNISVADVRLQSILPDDHPDKIVPLHVESLPDPKPAVSSLKITDLVAGEWYKFRFNRNLTYARLDELSGGIYFVTTELIWLGSYSRSRHTFSACSISSIELADMRDPIFEKHLPKDPRWYIKYPSYTRDAKFREDVDRWLESKDNTYSNLKPGDYYVKYNGLLCTQIVESGLKELSRDDFYRYILHKPVPPIKSASFSPKPGSEDLLDCLHSNPSISPVEIDRMPCGTSSEEAQKKVITGGVSSNITIKKTTKTRHILVESIKNIKP